MSSLLVALIPGLLMLATLGLDRVESSLRRDAISATDVSEFLNQAGAPDVDALARDGMKSALHTRQRRLSEQDSAPRGLGEHVPTSDLPTHRHIRHRANPEFLQTRHPNSV